MASAGEVIVVRSWRITGAEPSGAMMWFDPDREVPCLRSLPPISEDADGFYEGGALGGTLREERCVPLEGSEASTVTEDSNGDLPF